MHQEGPRTTCDEHNAIRQAGSGCNLSLSLYIYIHTDTKHNINPLSLIQVVESLVSMSGCLSYNCGLNLDNVSQACSIISSFSLSRSSEEQTNGLNYLINCPLPDNSTNVLPLVLRYIQPPEACDVFQMYIHVVTTSSI